MTPTDPLTLASLVETLTTHYGSFESAVLRHQNYRVYHNPWYIGGSGDGSFIFVTNKGHVKSGNSISSGMYMSSAMMGKIIRREMAVPAHILTAPSTPCLSDQAPNDVSNQQEITVARSATTKKAAVAKTPAKGLTKRTATDTRKAPAKAAAPVKAPAKATDGTGPKIDRSKYQYDSSDTKSASGRKTVNNGDALATALAGKTHTEVIDLVKANGGKVNDNWTNLNPGMQRMSAGNVLRAMWRKEGVITIDGKKVRAPAAA